MSSLVCKTQDNPIELSAIEKVVMQGDLSKLDPQQRVMYYHKVCESAGLNPYTQPFAYINLNGKLTLYAKKDCTEQLRKINGVSIEGLESRIVDDLFIVVAKAKDKTGRKDESTGVVTIGNLKGDAKANAIMKAETKAKRRVTLSISGMGWVDETEVESIPNAKVVNVDMSTGEINVTPVMPQLEAPTVSKIETVTEEQIVELKDVFSKCSKEYQKLAWNSWQRLYNLKKWEDLPAVEYDSIMEGALNHLSELAKERQQELLTAMEGE